MAQVNKLTFKVSLKGAISVYGLGRFPVTLYPEQWGKLFGSTELAQFVQNSTQACREQADKYAAAESIAHAKGLTDKAADEFIAKLVGTGTASSTKPQRSVRADLVESLLAQASAKGLA
jgi:hypothetical protein